MKNKFYTLITGLLMAACATSYGQEIVSEFTVGSIGFYTDIVETSDGKLLVGNGINPFSHEYFVYKTTTDGTILDSVRFASAYQLMEVPSMTDIFLVAGFSIDYASNVYNLTLTLIDADLNIVREAIIPVAAYNYTFWDYYVFFSPDDEIIFPYSMGAGDVFHILRISLDFNVLEDKSIPELPRGIWSNGHGDSTLFYTDIKAINSTPIRYQCLGLSVLGTDSIVFRSFLLDEGFSPVGSADCLLPDSNATFRDDQYTTAIPFIVEPSMARYGLMTTTVYVQDYGPQTLILKYNDKNVPVASHRFSGEYYPTGCGQMVAKDQSAIYFTFGAYTHNQFAKLTRMNSDLEVAWELPLSYLNYTQTVLNVLKVLENGNILVGAILYHINDDPILRVYIIGDNDPTNIPETEPIDNPITLYPNPVKDRLTLRFDEGQEPESVELYDLAGSLVAKNGKALESIDMSAMPAGVYMLCITFKDGERRLEKVIKE